MYVICNTDLWSKSIHNDGWTFNDMQYAQVALVNNLAQPFWRIDTENVLSEARCGEHGWVKIKAGIKYFAVRDLNYSKA